MSAPRSFGQVCEELDRRRRITLGLDRIEELLALLGHPERAMRVVQVVGTNGKGTTTAALAAALREAGHPSGAYFSPHVLSYTERVMLRNGYVSEERFATAMDRTMRSADSGGVPASQFELLTAGALQMFRDAGMSWAVLEAGLGARLDATTAARPEAVVLTNVGLDHTEYLGETIEEIAREKLASVPAGGVLVLGTGDPRVVAEARRRCRIVGAELMEAGSPAAPRAGPRNAPLAPHFASNVALGLRAAEVLLGRSFGGEARDRVARRVEGALPARFEVYEVRGVPVVVDGGHNPDGIEAVLGGVREVYGDRPLGVVFGVLRDKDVGSMLTGLKNEASRLVLTLAADERAADPRWLSHRYAPRDLAGRPARVVMDAVEALDEVVDTMSETNGVVLVTGSLSTGAAVLGWLREDR